MAVLVVLGCNGASVVTRPEPVEPSLTSKPASGLTQESTGFEITRTEAGETGFKLRAERLLGLVGGVYKLLAPRMEWRQGDGRTVFVSGQQGTFDAGSQRGRVQGDARAEDGAGAVVSADALEYLAGGEAILADGVARFRRAGLEGEGAGLRFDPVAQMLDLAREVRLRGTTPEGARGQGDWRLETENLHYSLGAAEMICGSFTLTASDGTLRGDELRLRLAAGNSRILRAEAIGHAELREPGSGASADLGGLARGDRIVVVPGASAEEPPRTVELRGAASLVPGERGGGLKELRAPNIILTREEGSSNRRVEAAIGATARLRGTQGTEGALEAERIEAVVDGEGRLVAGEAVGAVRYRGDEGTAIANVVLIEAGGDRLRLFGTPAQPPSLTDARTEVRAERIVLQRDSGVLEARGNVRTVSTATGSNGGLFDPTRPVHATADSLRAERDPDHATYEGGVRLWQGEAYLQADRAQIDRTVQRLEAEGRVVTRAAATQHKDELGPPRWLEGRSARFVYREERRAATYQGGALLVDGDQRITANEVEILLDEQRTLREVQAQGDVVLEAPGQHATAESLSYLPREGMLYLRGGDRPAEAQDTVHQRVVRGPTLTLRQLASRINLESGPGGRTWIMLDPQQKAAPEADGRKHDDGGERQPF